MLKENDIYATLGRRIKASIIDSTIYLFLFIFIALTIGQIVSDGGPIRILLMSIPLLFLEPFLVTFLGASIGQYILGMEVMTIGTRGKCSLFNSFVRYFAKGLLGSLSLIYMLFSKKHQAIHDHIANTVVLLSREKIKNNPSFANYGCIEQSHEQQYKYPHPLRRFFIFIFWFLISSVVIVFFSGIFAAFFIPTYSIESDKFPEGLDIFLNITISIAFIVLAFFAAKGRLLGARRSKLQNEQSTT